MKRYKTSYPGIFYREVDRIGTKGLEKVYYIVFKKDGKVLEEKVGRQYSDDMTPAKAARIRAERIEGKRLSRKEMRIQKEETKKAEENKWTIARLWGEYKNNHPHLKGMKTYIGQYNLYLDPVFGKKEPKEILPLDTDRLRINFLKTKSPQTVQHALELLRRIINYGVKKQLCAGLSFKIEMPVVDNKKTEFLTPEELKRLLDAIGSDPNIMAGNMIKLALFTGMRRGEMFKLKWGHIHFEHGFIQIVDPKGGPSQNIPLNDAAKELLLSHPRTDSPYVFPGKDGKQRVEIRRGLNRIKKNAGLPKDFRPLHGCRHHFASTLASSGQVDMFVIQKLLTHKDPAMTQRYAHLRDESLKKASNLVGDLVNKSIQKENIIDFNDIKRKT